MIRREIVEAPSGWRERHQAARLRGRPPLAPFARHAAVLAGLRTLPPALPIRAAIQFFDPK